MGKGMSSKVDRSLVSGVVDRRWWRGRVAHGSWNKCWEWVVGKFWLVVNRQWKVAWTGLKWNCGTKSWKLVMNESRKWSMMEWDGLWVVDQSRVVLHRS